MTPPVPLHARAVLAAALLALGCGGRSAGGQAPALDIRLAHGSDAERATAEALRRLVDAHDVGRWIFTPTAVIDERQIPHSHPVLTLHTRHLGDDEQLLATFLHEQFHWLAVERGEARDAAMAEFRRLFPDPPSSAEGGARDATSTWLHLVVNDLTLQATAELWGEERAERVARESTVYRWVNATVIDDPRVREVNRRHGLLVP